MKKRKSNKIKPGHDRLIFEILHDLRGQTCAELAAKSFLCSQTFFRLRQGPAHGGTRYPQGVTLQELARLAGGRLVYQSRVNSVEEDQNVVLFKPLKPTNKFKLVKDGTKRKAG